VFQTESNLERLLATIVVQYVRQPSEFVGDEAHTVVRMSADVASLA
jgi:hypothetical protein